MQRYWQRKPLLIRQAIAGFKPPVDAKALFALAGRETVESRLIQHHGSHWSLRHGPFRRRELPTLSQAAWTLLVQGVDLHDQRTHALLQRFSFIPQARLDDLMISFATDGGGVGPHFDSYDVFLLQAHGKRRWRIGRQKDMRLQPDVPLRILQNFEPEHEWVLEPGDMLYLPPRYAHDGIAEGDCMTYSVGFRSPKRDELGASLLERLAEFAQDTPASTHALDVPFYRDAGQPAVSASGLIPETLQTFAHDALARALKQPHVVEQALGEYLSEPKPQVFFDEDDAPANGVAEPEAATAVVLSRKTRMLYDRRFLYINGESYRCAGSDARHLRQLADQRQLPIAQLARMSGEAQEIVQEWHDQGWLFFIDAGHAG
ncbi:cupin domain-containing protein [Corticibacter populi]|uniref:Cupin domain-containing protein n=1 Tax=Corticibacter populi TaxID=1550736 RepID=A0A3M6R1L1_9BURK|nr:cupin domain-containing protein [Corticibacter populi]RMX08809.1 cupin domain-containing protein [Corticibacter populi]